MVKELIRRYGLLKFLTSTISSWLHCIHIRHWSGLDACCWKFVADGELDSETVKKNRVQADQARTSQRILLDRERSKSSAMLSRIGSIFHSKRQKASKPDISIPVPTLNSQRHSTRLSRPPGDGSEPRSATLPTPRPSIDTAALTPLMSAIPTEYIRPVARPRSDPDLGGAANGISITQLVHSIRSRATKETDPERKYWLLSFAVVCGTYL